MIIDNKNLFLKDVLKEKINNADELIIVSPFISSSDTFFSLLESSIKLTIICRLSHPATPDFFRKVLPFLNQNKQVLFFYDDSLHAKIYIFKKNKKSFCAIVGSSNFTDNGLQFNKEMNILMTEELSEIDKYIDWLKHESDGLLDKKIVDDYSSFYVAPNNKKQYKKVKINLNLVTEYENILERYYIIKGILEKESNEYKIPFTYIFDGFCHYFKNKIRVEYNVNSFSKFEKNELVKYYRIYLNDYLKNSNDTFRESKYNKCSKIRKGLSKIKDEELKEFILGLHSVSYGSGSGKRKESIRKTPIKQIRTLIDFIINSDLSIGQKYSVALTKQNKNGLKVDYLGKSAIGEIPGWLLPNKFPIKNDKFLYILDFFKV